MSPVTAFSLRRSSGHSHELHGPTQSADPALSSRPTKSDCAETIDEQNFAHSSLIIENESPFSPSQPETFDVVEWVDQSDSDPVRVQPTTSVEETGDPPEFLAERYEVRETIGGWS